MSRSSHQSKIPSLKCQLFPDSFSLPAQEYVQFTFRWLLLDSLFADNSLTQFTSILVASMKEGRIMGPFEKELKWARGEYAEECQLI